MPLPTFASIHEIIAGSIARTRFNTMLLGVFAALALGITIIGVYSMAAYAVASRTRDIGVRMALGAAPHMVVAEVMRYGMLPVIAGLGAGLVAAYGLTRVLRSMIYGVTAHDPATLGLTTAILLTAALVGTWLPARRAARIDPVIALRSE
jgi:ABC-type antimicrobial peptide transport system permease subunit